jgi:hypothetical protein
MNPLGKKFISSFLIFSLVMLSGNLLAKESRGAILIIWKKNGQQIEGELIAVKKDSLLLFTGRDLSIDIEDIKIIRIFKKIKVLKILKGMGIGLLIGGAAGASLGFAMGDPEWTPGWNLQPSAKEKAFIFGILFGLCGAYLGGVVGKYQKDKIIQMEGMPDSEIQETLEYLRKKARIPDYK